MKTDIEKYILDHISPEPSILEELYRKTFTSVVNPNMVSGHLQGRVLKMIVSMISPDRVLEIGTYTGYSAISMASAMPEGSKLHTIEINDELYDLSAGYIERSGLSDRIEMHTGDAKLIIPEYDFQFDLVFIDGDKREYSEYFKIVFPKLRTGGFIIADNVLWDGKVVDPDSNDPMTTGIREFNDMVRHHRGVEQVVLPLRDGLMLIRKV